MDENLKECAVTVNLVKRKNGGVGFLVSNASPYLTVSHVVKGGVAHETGFIEEGDVILGINGKSLENVPYLNALEIIDKIPIGEPLEFKIRAREGFQAYLETAFDKEGVVKTVRSTKPKTSPESGMGAVKKDENLVNGNVLCEKSNGYKQEPRYSEEEKVNLKEEKVFKTVQAVNTKASPEGAGGMDEKVNGEKQREKIAKNEEKLTLSGTAEADKELARPEKESEARSESNCTQKCPVTSAIPQFQQPKYIKLENLLTNTFSTDTLHQKAIQVS